MSIMFNEICINEEMLPKYTYIYIYVCVCVCVCLCVCVNYLCTHSCITRALTLDNENVKKCLRIIRNNSLGFVAVKIHLNVAFDPLSYRFVLTKNKNSYNLYSVLKVKIYTIFTANT